MYFNNINLWFYKTLLYSAVEKENIDIIELLLTNSELDLNAFSQLEEEEETALFKAIQVGNIDIIKILLANDKIDVNVLNTIDYGSKVTALYLAISNEKNEIIKLLLKNDRLDINKFSLIREDVQSLFFQWNDRLKKGRNRIPFTITVF